MSSIRNKEPSIDILREFHVSGNEQKFQQIISELKFLSKVKPLQKINVSTKEILSNTYNERFRRTLLRTEDKIATLNYVRKVINESIDQLYFFKSLTDPFYHQLGEIIKKEIMAARHGIESLSRTYSSNDALSSDFESIITSINVKLQI